MDIYKLEFTKLQQEIMRFLFLNVEKKFNQRELSRKLHVSPTAISKSLKLLKKERIITLNKNESYNGLEIGLDIENENVFQIKRSENLNFLVWSGLTKYLFELFPTATVILFGSYSRGEDISTSDIDIAIIGAEEEKMKLVKFEKILFRKINLQFYDSFNKIHENLKVSILNGIVLRGSVEL